MRSKRCPIFRKQRGKAVNNGSQSNADQTGPGPRMHHTNLTATLMPMLALEVPPGFSSRPNLVAPEVFEQMQVYMNCTDPEERRIREFKMKSVFDNLSKDPIAQRFALRLESAPRVSNIIHKDVGEVYKFRTEEESRTLEVVETSTPATQQMILKKHTSDASLTKSGDCNCRKGVYCSYYATSELLPSFGKEAC